MVDIRWGEVRGGRGHLYVLAYEAATVCLVASKVEAEGAARLLCLSIPRKPKVRQTLMGCPREPRLDER